MVIIGSSAPSVQDLHRTPTSGDSFMAGPEIQANAIRTALRGLPLRTAPRWLDVLSIVLLALLIPLLGLFTRALRAVLAAPLLAALFVAANYLAFTSGTVLVAAAPLAALFVSVAGTVMAGYLFETRERRRVAEYNGLLAQRVASAPRRCARRSSS
jgi:CHASE2 domain-containing sensor protein